MKIKAIFPIVGGKWRLSRHLVRLVPRHQTYVEVFGGSGALLFTKQPSDVECINDTDSEIVNFFRVLQRRRMASRLIEELCFVPYSRQVYEEACKSEIPRDPVLRAKRFFILAKMAWGGYRSGGRKTGQSPGRWRFSVGNHCAGAKEVNQFKRTIEQLDRFADRLRHVYIEHSDFRKVFQQWDRGFKGGPGSQWATGTFFFVDPPYVGTEGYYRGNFSEQDHRDLSVCLNEIQGKAMVTYYPNPLIDELYPEPKWRRIHLSSVKNAQCANGSRSRVEELVLMNYKLEKQQRNLFDA